MLGFSLGFVLESPKGRGICHDFQPAIDVPYLLTQCIICSVAQVLACLIGKLRQL